MIDVAAVNGEPLHCMIPSLETVSERLIERVLIAMSNKSIPFKTSIFDPSRLFGKNGIDAEGLPIERTQYFAGKLVDYLCHVDA